MIRDRRSSERVLSWAVCLATALAVALSAQPAAAAPRVPSAASPDALSADPIPTRIEGYLRSTNGATWLVDQTPVRRRPATTLIEKRGEAVAGAWVLVAGLQYADRLDADTIEVLRAVGAPAPAYQFTGIVRKQGSVAWVVEDTIIDVTANTRIVGDIPLNSLARVTMQRTMAGVEALEIRAIAPDVASVPFAIDGTVEQVTDDKWVVDSETVVVPPEKGVTANQGDTVEVSAVVNKDGALVAQEAQVVDTSHQTLLTGYVSDVKGQGEDNQTWTLLVFEGGRVAERALNVTPETYVDEDRAVAEANVEAEVEGSKKDASSVDAASIRLQQPTPATAAGGLTQAGTDELWRVGNQPVWFETENLMQAARAAASPPAASLALDAGRTRAALQPPARVVVRGVRLSNGVLIAKEVLTADAAQAAGAVSSSGVEAASANALSATDWFGPTVISPSLGAAAKPTVLFDANGRGHAVYESLGKIYYAHQESSGSWSPPQKIGTGRKPAATFDSKGELHVAYANDFLESRDILHVRLTPAGWTLPHVVAPTTGSSEDPAIAADATGNVYVAWMDRTSGEWAIQIGVWDGSYWTSYPVSNARGQSPAVTVMPDSKVFIAWQDRIPLADDSWGDYDIFTSERKDRWAWSLPVNVSENWKYRPGSNSIGARVVGVSEGAGQALAHVAWIDDARQVRYVFGRGAYWPVPVDVTSQRSNASGLSMQFAVEDGLVYMAWDEGGNLQVTASPPRTTAWPQPGTIAVLNAAPQPRVWDVSLAATGDGIALAWAQTTADGKMAVYESRHGMPLPMLKSYLPFLFAR